MVRLICALSLVLILAALTIPGHAGFKLPKELRSATSLGSGLDESTIVKGLKEALATGTARAVKSVAKQDGYFNNESIKILLPERLRPAADLLRQFGFQPQVDEFVLGMNRAAEKAAPMATDYFVSAVKEMSFEDARKILKGSDTAATEYFRGKTGDKILTAFLPVVSSTMQEVGVVRSYTEMINKVPFGAAAVGSLDLDQYVAGKAVDGLFVMLGEEEKKIRKDPAARGTKLLKKVFGRL